jgi:hypothetical protein
VIKTNRFNAEMIPSPACTRRTQGRRLLVAHNFAGVSRGSTTVEVRTPPPSFPPVGSASVFLQSICI